MRKGRISCTADIDSLESVSKSSGSRMASGWLSPVPTGLHTIHPRRTQKYTGQSNFRCENGEYRTAASGRGVYGGRPSWSMAWQYSGTVTNPCG